MMKNGFKFKFSPKDEIIEFILNNSAYYSKKFLESHPQYASNINDGDFNPMLEHIEKDVAIADMVECYEEWLLSN